MNSQGSGSLTVLVGEYVLVVSVRSAGRTIGAYDVIISLVGGRHVRYVTNAVWLSSKEYR